MGLAGLVGLCPGWRVLLCRGAPGADAGDCGSGGAGIGAGDGT